MTSTSQQPATRPTERTDELIEKILFGLSRGRSLATICEPSSMPLWSSVLNWVSSDKRLAHLFELASEVGRAFLADRLIDIADEVASYDADKDEAPCEKAIRWAKLRIDTRMKILSKWKPMTIPQLGDLLNEAWTHPPYTEPSAQQPSKEQRSPNSNQPRQPVTPEKSSEHTRAESKNAESTSANSPHPSPDNYSSSSEDEQNGNNSESLPDMQHIHESYPPLVAAMFSGHGLAQSPHSYPPPPDSPRSYGDIFDNMFGVPG